MIPDQWYAVLSTGQVKPGKPLGVTRLGEKLVFWRDRQGKVHALRDFCPHRGVALSAGKVIGDQIQCPFHGFEYDASGRCTLLPANGSGMSIPKQFQAQGYPIYEAHGFIFLYWGSPQFDPPAPQFFDNLGETFEYADAIDPWRAHYSRVIENQLDVAHLPFVHYNSIGRGGRMVVEGPLLEWVNDDKFKVFVFNRQDDGSPPRSPANWTPVGASFTSSLFSPTCGRTISAGMYVCWQHLCL